MENKIIRTKIDWVATLGQFLVGDIYQFDVGAKEVFNIRQVAHRFKKRDRKIFSTSTLDNGIVVTRLS